MKFCPQCGTTFEPQARFCLECGFDRSIVEPPGPEVTTSPGVIVTETHSTPVTPGEVPHLQAEDTSGCPHCGSTVDKTDRFCQECGFDTLKSESLVNDNSAPNLPFAEEEIIIPPASVEEAGVYAIPAEEPATPPVNKQFCPQCSSGIEAGVRFCQECGYDTLSGSISFPEVSQPIQQPAVEETGVPAIPAEEPVSLPENKQFCPQCDSGIEPGERFCPECGFDTVAGTVSLREVSQPIQQPAVEEAGIDEIPAEGPVSPPENKQFCPQCGSGIEPGERFCRECGFDASPDKFKGEINPEPANIPSVSAPPPLPNPAITPPSPQPAPSPEAAYTRTERSGEPQIQRKGKKTLLWIVLLILVLGALGAAGWFVYDRYLSTPKEAPTDSVITMGIPENTEIATDAINEETTDQPEVAATEQPKANTKHLSRMDQELAKQKAKAPTQPAQPANTDEPPVITPHITANDIIVKILLEVGKKEETKHKNPKNPAKLSLQKPTMIVRITTDHYNDGMGTPGGGVITIKNGSGNIIGTYKAQGKTGKNGTPSAKWVATPNIMLEKGTYYISDSEPSTWSKTLIGGNGFIVVEGYEVE